MSCFNLKLVCLSQLGLTVFMNIAGALFAITAIVLYVINLENVPLVWVCDSSRNSVLRKEDSCGRMALFVQVKTTKILKGMRVERSILMQLSIFILTCAYCRGGLIQKNLNYY